MSITRTDRSSTTPPYRGNQRTRTPRPARHPESRGPHRASHPARSDRSPTSADAAEHRAETTPAGRGPISADAAERQAETARAESSAPVDRVETSSATGERTNEASEAAQGFLDKIKNIFSWGHRGPEPQSEDAERIEDIARQEEDLDTGSRNRQITEEYTRLGQEFDEVLGPGAGNNWLSYAAHASNAVGGGIRGEEDVDLPGPINVDTPGQSREALADGNQEVFSEIAPHFQSFIDTFGDAEAKDPEAFQRWVDEQDFRRSDPENQDHSPLEDAFRNYYDAKFETDVRKKQELTLNGNIYVAEHEQIRLDDEIDRAFDPHKQGGLTGFLSSAVDTVVPGDPVQDLANSQVAFELDGQELKAGDDIPQPMTLGNLVDEFDEIGNQELRDNLIRIQDDGSKQSNPDDLSGTDVPKWHDLDERLYWITELMRQSHTDPAILAGPAAA
ncbi:MAG: hypothetical protein AB7S38_34530 [Vulcanimicrobiota bacterium]